MYVENMKTRLRKIYKFFLDQKAAMIEKLSKDRFKKNNVVNKIQKIQKESVIPELRKHLWVVDNKFILKMKALQRRESEVKFTLEKNKIKVNENIAKRKSFISDPE